MTAAAATPQVMRDRLLQAIDGQSNICNMVVVMEVISFLERHPITKEALEETRLGKLINDVRKKTRNEDLAKRAKKLLRNWLKLIEPGKDEVPSKGQAVASWSSNGCISSPAVTTPSGKTGAELKNRNDFNNCSTPGTEKRSQKKRKISQMEGELLPAKKPKMTLNDKVQNSKQLPTNGIRGSSDFLTDLCAHQPLHGDVSEPLDADRQNKILVSAVKPHPCAPGHNKLPSTSSLLKASVQQQQTAFRGQHQLRTLRSSLLSPQATSQEADFKEYGSVDTSESSIQPYNSRVQGLRSADFDSKSKRISCNSSLSAGVSVEKKSAAKAHVYKPEDCTINSEEHPAEDSTKLVRLKDRKLTFNPVTGQIRPSSLKEPCQGEEVTLSHRPESQQSDLSKQNPAIPPSPFQQTDWKELSRSEIIQSYLSQQSSMLSSSGAHTPGAQFFMAEFLKKDEHQSKHAKKTHTLAPELPAKDLPGVSREVDDEDLRRLHMKHWSGVNGCYDTKGEWYGWTECISLDLHGDESMLNILPYVCLD